jgi:hypothetical protein
LAIPLLEYGPKSQNVRVEGFEVGNDETPPVFTTENLLSPSEMGNLIEERDLIKPYDEKHMSNPDMWAINNRYQLAYANDNLVVKSNFLSQQFAE